MVLLPSIFITPIKKKNCLFPLPDMDLIKVLRMRMISDWIKKWKVQGAPVWLVELMVLLRAPEAHWKDDNENAR